MNKVYTLYVKATKPFRNQLVVILSLYISWMIASINLLSSQSRFSNLTSVFLISTQTSQKIQWKKYELYQPFDDRLPQTLAVF